MTLIYSDRHHWTRAFYTVLIVCFSDREDVSPTSLIIFSFIHQLNMNTRCKPSIFSSINKTYYLRYTKKPASWVFNINNLNIPLCFGDTICLKCNLSEEEKKTHSIITLKCVLFQNIQAEFKNVFIASSLSAHKRAIGSSK